MLNFPDRNKNQIFKNKGIFMEENIQETDRTSEKEKERKINR